jgi:hypothetical protein
VNSVLLTEHLMYSTLKVQVAKSVADPVTPCSLSADLHPHVFTDQLMATRMVMDEGLEIAFQWLEHGILVEFFSSVSIKQVALKFNQISSFIRT